MLVEWLAEVIALYPLVLVLLLAHIALMFFALSDLSKQETTRGPKGVWVVVIILINFIGPLAYYFIGRQNSDAD